MLFIFVICSLLDLISINVLEWWNVLYEDFKNFSMIEYRGVEGILR